MNELGKKIRAVEGVRFLILLSRNVFISLMLASIFFGVVISIMLAAPDFTPAGIVVIPRTNFKISYTKETRIIYL